MAKKKIIKKTPTCNIIPSHVDYYGGMVLVVGILVLLNALYSWLNWGVFIGCLIILKGIVLLIHNKLSK